MKTTTTSETMSLVSKRLKTRFVWSHTQAIGTKIRKYRGTAASSP